MKKLLNEEINYKIERGINGTPIAYIDPITSENVYPFKDIIKKYGAKWDTRFKRWYWLLSNDSGETQRILNKYVNPCIDELTSLEIPKENVRRKPQDIKDQIQKVVSELNKIIGEGVDKVDSTSVNEDEFYFPVNCIQQYMIPSDTFVIKCMFYGKDKIDFEFETSVHDFEEDMEKHNINPIEYEVTGILTNEKAQVVFEIEKIVK
jgi:hypothetical protein